MTEPAHGAHTGAVMQWEVSGSVTVLVVEPDREFHEVPEEFWPLIEAAEAEGFNIVVIYEEGPSPQTVVRVEHE